MSTQYKGSILSSTEQPTSGSVAQGIWNTSDVMQSLKASAWPNLILPIEYLVLAGGGAGAAGNPGNIGNGGGGAGGLLTSTVNLNFASAYTFTVGAGATGTVAGAGNVASNGSNSVISGTGITTITALGGGSAKAYISGAFASNSGGCGGGGTYSNIAAGSGTAGQGYAGGAGVASGVYSGGGGGGTGIVGFSGSAGGQGGQGATSSIIGTSTYYGGGGGAGTLGGTPVGGLGGGGTGGSGGAGTAGTTNLGGGGGGAGGGTATGANGGSGVIIVAYPNSYPNASAVSAGLTVNGSAGNTTPDTSSRAGYKIYKITAGTGTITW